MSKNQGTKSRERFVGRAYATKHGYRLAQVKSRNTTIEMLVFRLLRQEGLTFSKHANSLPGSPDVVFDRHKIAVFLDGDFWHGRNLVSLRRVGKFGSRREYWLGKIRRNVDRDKTVTRKLRSMGWQVLRFWESDIEKTPADIVKAIRAAIGRRLLSPIKTHL